MQLARVIIKTSNVVTVWKSGSEGKESSLGVPALCLHKSCRLSIVTGAKVFSHLRTKQMPSWPPRKVGSFTITIFDPLCRKAGAPTLNTTPSITTKLDNNPTTLSFTRAPHNTNGIDPNKAHQATVVEQNHPRCQHVLPSSLSSSSSLPFLVLFLPPTLTRHSI